MKKSIYNVDLKYCLRRYINYLIALLCVTLLTTASPALSEWRFSDSPSPNAFILTGGMNLELSCDRIRFSPASGEDAKDIENKQGLSMRFMQNTNTMTSVFQIGRENAYMQIINERSLEITFTEKSDYDFVLTQLAKNRVLNLAMVDEDTSYGIIKLKGSHVAIKELRSRCAERASEPARSFEIPKGVVYCGGDVIKRRIKFHILDNPEGEWDARVTVNGQTIRAMTAFSYFGNSKIPRGFVVALLGEDRSEFLVFRDGGMDWLEFGDYTYRKCN